jgi:S-formylglutathione hydrolase FrmB
MRDFLWFAIGGLLGLSLLMPNDVDATNSSAPVLNPQTGYWECTLTTPHQPEPALVQILLPDRLDPHKPYPVLYILPVEPAHRNEYGSGLAEAKKAGAANKYGVICVYPSFAKIAPWYGNHATDPSVRQDDYMVKALVPFIDRTYPTQADKEGRWLIGFSKSAWGAFTLLFRHPDVFGYAAGWDSPLMLNGDNNGADWGPMGLSLNFGTKEAMQQSLPTKLAEQNASWLKERCRVVFAPGISWKVQTEQYHSFLMNLGIPQDYRADLLFPHRWDSGWFAPLLEELVKTVRAK